jgi:serine/threonine protein phosphatase 1
MRYVALRGNHERMLETFLSDPSAASQWRQLGGLETLHSYGVPVDQVMIGRGYDEAAAALRASISQEQVNFLSSLKNWYSVGGFFVCHAGVRPGVPLERQSDDDLLWIRGEFLKSKVDFGKLVIHGHTPVEWPEILPNRINIDTGAYLTGRLTCLVLDRGVRRFIFTAYHEQANCNHANAVRRRDCVCAFKSAEWYCLSTPERATATLAPGPGVSHLLCRVGIAGDPTEPLTGECGVADEYRWITEPTRAHLDRNIAPRNTTCNFDQFAHRPAPPGTDIDSRAFATIQESA